MKIYIPVCVMQTLSDEARTELLMRFHDQKIYGPSTINHTMVKLVEDETYIKLLPLFEQIVQLFEKNDDAERELKHLREIKKSVDEMKRLFK
jgi:hypothetical protein